MHRHRPHGGSTGTFVLGATPKPFELHELNTLFFFLFSLITRRRFLNYELTSKEKGVYNKKLFCFGPHKISIQLGYEPGTGS